LYEGSTIATDTLACDIDSTINVYSDGTSTVSLTQTGVLGTLNVFSLQNGGQPTSNVFTIWPEGGVDNTTLRSFTTVDAAITAGLAAPGNPTFVFKTTATQTPTVNITKASTWIGELTAQTPIDLTGVTVGGGAQTFKNIYVTILDVAITLNLIGSTASLPNTVNSLEVNASSGSVLNNAGTVFTDVNFTASDSTLSLASHNLTPLSPFEPHNTNVSLTNCTTSCLQWGAGGLLNSFDASGTTFGSTTGYGPDGPYVGTITIPNSGVAV
jgi:hypothetical protein